MTTDEKPRGEWVLKLICCDRHDGYQVCASAAEAAAFRESYIDKGPSPNSYSHERVAILSTLATPMRLGFHEESEALA